MSAVINNFNLDKYSEFSLNLTTANEYFKSNGIATKENKDRLIRILQSAYRQLHLICKEMGKVPDDLAYQASRLFYLYGRCTYGGDMEATRKIFMLALNLGVPRLPQIVQNCPINTLKECSELSWVHLNLSRETEEKGIEATIDFVENYPKKGSFSLGKETSKPLAFAHLLRFTGHCYQNIDVYNAPSERNISRLEKIYAVCKNILDHIDPTDQDAEVRWEKIELIYNTSRILYALRNPNDPMGALKTLDQIFPLLDKENSERAEQRKAQILNIKNIETSKLIDKAQTIAEKEQLILTCNSYVNEAYAVACKIHSFDPFLKHLFLHNMLGLQLKYFTLTNKFHTDKEDLHKAIQTLLNFMQSQNYDHYYYARFVLTTAKCAIYLKDSQAVRERIQLCKDICTKFPDSTKDVKVEIQLLEQIITP